ncbi:MAG: hypothetical protein Kow0059_09870 [Candidatus Sumerlaeia bacterium]
MDNTSQTPVHRWLHHAVLVLTSAVFMLPFVWLVSSSLKLEKDLFTFPPRFIPRQDHIELKGIIQYPPEVETFDYKGAIRSENEKLKGRLVRARNRGPMLQELQVTVEDGRTFHLDRWFITSLTPERLTADGGDVLPRGLADLLATTGTVRLSAASGLLLLVNQNFEIKVQDATLAYSRRINPVWSNYLDVFYEAPLFGRFILNSFYLVALNLAGVLVSSTLVAYSFARLRWKGRDLLFVLVLSTMMLPMQVTMIPQFLIYRELGWVNTLKPLWVFSWFGHAFFIFLLREFFKTLPADLEEAAKIDGAGYFRTWLQIMLPQIKPALITVAVWQFLWTWNDFMGPLIYIIDAMEKMPLSLGLAQFQATRANQDFALLMAGSTMMTLPVILIFLLSQRQLIKGMTLAGVNR